MEVEPPADLGVLLPHVGAQLVDLVGHRHAGGVGQGYLGDAHLQVGLNDGLHIGQGDAALPGGGEGHGDGARDGDAVLAGGLHTAGEAGHALLRGHVQVLQVVLAAGRYIQLYLFAAALHRPLHPPEIGDQRPQLHAGELAHGFVHLVGIRHLGDRLGVHEGADFDNGEARGDQPPQQLHLLLGGNEGLFVLQAVPEADLAQRNG